MKIGTLGEIYLEREQFFDARGSLTRVYDAIRFESLKADFNASEVFFSNSKKGAIRGIHCPIADKDFWRVIGVVCGEIEDVLIDLRLESPTRGKVVKNFLTDSSPFMLVPMGIGHGFQSVFEDSQVLYIFGIPYADTREMGINPLSACFSWQIEASAISDKDKALPFYEE